MNLALFSDIGTWQQGNSRRNCIDLEWSSSSVNQDSEEKWRGAGSLRSQSSHGICRTWVFHSQDNWAQYSQFGKSCCCCCWLIMEYGLQSCWALLTGVILNADSSQDQYFCSPEPWSLIPYEKHFSFINRNVAFGISSCSFAAIPGIGWDEDSKWFWAERCRAHVTGLMFRKWCHCSP